MRVMLTAGFAIVAAAFQSTGFHKRAQEPVTAFVDVGIIPMTSDGALDHQTVIVRGGRIAQIGPASQVRAPAGAVTIVQV